MSGADYFAAVDATWPAAERRTVGPWVLRAGQGGGKRVSAATAQDATALDHIEDAEAGMRSFGQAPLFMLRPGEEALDAELARRGYGIVDPTVLLCTPVARLTDTPVPRVTAFCIWEPLAIMEEIWAAGGIGPARLAVMERAAQKTGILARWNEKPAGAAFVAMSGDVGVVHAVEILPHQRRQGVAGWVMRAAAFWAAKQGAAEMMVLCTRANAAALALYSSLGFEEVGHYHYRLNPARKTEPHG
ncbi:GNAT family N-acetyltransferase [uncultured Roseobacter sp.]|uniref:GNAT family N-acetyltransferase n=1 Tax=uncultured Roseobacter sp. TaxID=114847 RepID=UPI00261A42B4|nr:GNAT family N-acetyltransferase [uncultured Roseobacter sp.]